MSYVAYQRMFFFNLDKLTYFNFFLSGFVRLRNLHVHYRVRERQSDMLPRIGRIQPRGQETHLETAGNSRRIYAKGNDQNYLNIHT